MMRGISVSISWRSTWALLVLLSLAACSSAPVVERVRTVRVQVPVIQPIPSELLADCPPRFEFEERAAPITVRDVLERLASAEDALAICRRQLSLLREQQGGGGAK